MKQRGNIPDGRFGGRHFGKPPYSGDAGAWRRLEEVNRNPGEPEIEAERLSRGATVFPAEYPELSGSADEMF